MKVLNKKNRDRAILILKEIGFIQSGYSFFDYMNSRVYIEQNIIHPHKDGDDTIFTFLWYRLDFSNNIYYQNSSFEEFMEKYPHDLLLFNLDLFI